MNTKITFYYTDTKQGQFGKTVFETIIEGTPFEDINDAIEWEENIVQEVWDTFDFQLIFDRIVLGYEETESPIKEVEIIKHEIGTLTFGKTKIEKKSTPTTKSIEEIKKEIQELKKETIEINIDTQKSIEERKIFEEKTKSIEKAIEKIKEETKKIEEETKNFKIKKTKIKKDHASVWIEPDGTVHELSFAQHNEFASEWLQERIGLSKMVHDSRYPYEQLQEDFGWLRVLGWSNPPQFVFPNKLTPKQKQAVRDYCANERIGLPERLKN